MSAQQVFEKHVSNPVILHQFDKQILAAMKEYAELYATKALKLAADNMQINIFYDEFDYRGAKESITGIKLPEHI